MNPAPPPAPHAQRLGQFALSTLRWLMQFRYVKFGMVGASGTVLNLLVLYVGREFVFTAWEGHSSRPYISLAFAIAIATLNNFTWNRLWTWADRQTQHTPTNEGAQTATTTPSLTIQFFQYALASWLGIALQYGITLWLSGTLHYMLANLIGIVIASASNFLANDRWTFRKG